MSTLQRRPQAGGHAPRRRRASPLVAAVVLLLACDAAHAGLGEPAGSVRRDVTALRGVMLTQRAAGALRIHEITTADGTRVREYESAGAVFATTWQGPALPDLMLLLGRHYGSFAAAARDGAGTAKVLAFGNGELVLRVARLPRGIAGSAYLPALLPPGGLAAIEREEPAR